MNYAEFLQKKSVTDPDTGLSSIPELNPMLYPHQADMVKWALRRGRAALFADCGIGKGPMRYASPVWMDINFSNTLNARAARDHEDERHVCPMSLDLIERAITLWSNTGDVVFDPFSGVGSTGYQAIKMGRKFVGSELKQSYFVQACKNIDSAKANQGGLFT